MNDSHHIEELETWISDYLSGNYTEEEKETLFTYLAFNEDAAKIFQEMFAVWAVSSVPVFAKIGDTSLSQIKEQITTAEMKPVCLQEIVPLWLKVTVAIILLLGYNYSWYTCAENFTEVYTNADSPYETKVPVGSRTNVVLPDGAGVSLNARSVLRYCRGFDIREYDVALDGEGHFKVAENAKISSFINTGGVQVKVMEAVFNVRVYNDDNHVMISLLEGRVSLAASSGPVMKLFLNEQAFYDKNTGHMEKMESNASSTCDWLGGGPTFENIPFAGTARRLERRFQVEISLESERLEAERFSGYLNSSQSISNILGEVNIGEQYTQKASGDTIFTTDKKKEVK